MKRLPHMQLCKLLALTLTIILLTMSLSGCFGNADPTEPSDSQISSTEATDATDAAEETTPPTETEPEVVMGTVNTDKLNVRTKANPNSPSVNKLAVGTRLEILEQLTVDDVTWGRIAEGWVNMKYVTLDSEAGNIVEDPGTTEAPEPTEPAPSTSTGSGTTGTVTAGSLHIRKGPGTKYDSVGKLKKGDTVVILETSGNWGKTEKGWVSLKYIDLDGSSTSGSSNSSNSSSSSSSSASDSKYSTLVTDGNTKALGKVKVGDSGLNIRYGPSTDYEKLGTIKSGETVTYYQKSGNWIRISNGWISYKYVTEVTSSSNTTYTTGKATITASALFVREGAGTSYDQVDKLYKGTIVEILEVKGNWGRIEKGWICLDYVDMG